jgi:hypothetical protein
MPKKKVKDIFRQQLATAMGKIAAFRAVGNIEEAKVWSQRMVELLKTEGLL